MLEDVRSTNKDVYNLGALVVSIEASFHILVKLQNNEKWQEIQFSSSLQIWC